MSREVGSESDGGDDGGDEDRAEDEEGSDEIEGDSRVSLTGNMGGESCD
jgi:hypothetical protein